MFSTTVSYKNESGIKVELKGQKWECIETADAEVKKLVKKLEDNGCTDIVVRYFDDFGEINRNDADLFEDFDDYDDNESILEEEDILSDEEFDEMRREDGYKIL